MYAKFKPDTEKLLMDCFDYDYLLSKIDKIFKDKYQLLKTKDILLKHYQLIKDSYKKFSGDEMENEKPAISCKAFIEIMKNCNFVDGINVTDQIIEIEFTLVN